MASLSVYAASVPLPKMSTIAILLHIAAGSDDTNFANAICKATGFPSGTVVPALGRMADRDGLLGRHEQATSTGRPRLVYSLTSSGRAEVDSLVRLFVPRVSALCTATPGEVPEVRINTSTLWLLSAALLNNGDINGHADSLRPLTHQAAYAELARLQPAGLFVPRAGGHSLTATGHALAALEGAKWEWIVQLAV